MQIGDGRAFYHPPTGGLMRRTKLSATTKLTFEYATLPFGWVLLSPRLIGIVDKIINSFGASYFMLWSVGLIGLEKIGNNFF